MKLTAILLCLTALVLCADDGILFQANFNTSTAPQIARGGGLLEAKEVEINAGAGYPFKNSIPVPAGADLRKHGACLIYPAKGNFDTVQGTLQLWVKPTWKAGRSFYARIFSLVFDSAKRDQVEMDGCTGFVLGKSEKSMSLELRNMRNWKDFKIEADVSDWQPDQWYHVTVTWQKGGKKIIYVNGAEAASGNYHLPKDEPQEIIFGAPTYRIDAECSIDEVRILNRPLSPDEVAKSYEMQKSGLEFEAPASEARKAFDQITAVFEPQEIKAQATADFLLSGDKLDIFFTQSSVKVDGNLDDPAWQSVKPLPNLILRGGGTPQAASEIKMAYDEKYLYFGCKFQEPQMNQLQANFDQNDLNIYNDDCLELLFDTGKSPDTTYHVVTNVLGAIYDSRNGNLRFDLRHALAKGKRQSDHWTLELAIPFADLNLKTPLPGQSWGMRICRERKTTVENSSFPAAPTGTAFNARRHLAQLTFRGSSGDAGSLSVAMDKSDFLPGLNLVNLTVKNPAKEPRKVFLSAQTLNRDSETLQIYEKELALPPESAQVVPMELIISDADITGVAFRIREGQKVIWADNLDPDFTASPVSTRQLDRTLAAMESDLLIWQGKNRNVVDSLRRSLQLMREKQQDFSRKTAGAIKNRTTLPQTECTLYAAAVNGFIQWLNEHRMILWQVSPWENGSPADFPAALEKTALKFRQAGNEWEFKAIAINGLLPGGGLECRLAVSDLYDARGNRYNRSKVYVFNAPYVRNSAGELVTDVLLEDDGDTFTILPGTTSRLWIAVHSKDMAPGNYTGTITVKPVDIQALPRGLWPTVDFSVEVLPFAFPEAPQWPVDCYLWTGGFTPVESEIPLINFFQKFHINWMMTDESRYTVGKLAYGVYRNPGRELKPENIRVNDEFLQAAKARNMNLLFAWTCSKDPAWVKGMSDHLVKLGFDYSQFMFSGMKDEFHSKDVPELLPLQAKACEAAPQVRWAGTFTSVPPPNGTTFEQMDEVVKYLKTPILYNTNVWPPDSQRAKEVQAWLKKHPDLHPWFYRCSRGMQKMPLISYYRSGPLTARVAGVKGFALWTLSSLKGKQVMAGEQKIWHTPDGFFDLESTENGDLEGICFYHPRKNVIPTKRFMALVKGLEDYALVDILSKQLPAGSKYAELFSDAALTKLFQQESQDAMDAWRRAMQDAILATRK